MNTRETPSWNASLYDGKHSFVTRYGESLIELLGPLPGEEILDLGCGTGDLTLRLQQAGARPTGFDQSEAMLAAARRRFDEAARSGDGRRAGSAADIPLIQGDVRTLDARECYDAVFSNAVLHWVPEAEEAARSIYRCLRPGGRFVAELGGKDNNRRMLQALEQAMGEILDGPLPVFPWYFPSPDEYRAVLESVGFRADSLCWFRRPTLLDDGAVIDWYRMFVGNWWKEPAVNTETQESVFRRATEIVAPRIERGGRHYADYIRLRVVAVREVTPSARPLL